MQKGYREIRGNLGFFGVLWRILFWGWQILMLVSCAGGLLSMGEELARNPAQNEWEEAGINIGITLGLGMNFVIWASGSVVFGIPMVLTRPARAIVKDD